jgi:hypothetical protein
VELTRRPFERLGDANSWLLSEAFDQLATGSIDAEEAMRDARQQIALGDQADKLRVREIEIKLKHVLGGTDPFWNRWRFAEQQGGWKL